MHRSAEAEAQDGNGRFDISFIVAIEGNRCDADTSWMRHRDFASIDEIKCADPCPNFVFDLHGDKSLECLEMAKIMSCLLRNDFLPIHCLWIYLRSDHHPEIGRVEVSPDKEYFADMIDLVHDAAPAWLDNFQFAGGLICAQVSHLAGMFSLNVDQHELPRLRKIEPDAKRGIFLFIDEDISCRIAPDSMSPNLGSTNCYRVG